MEHTQDELDVWRAGGLEVWGSNEAQRQGGLEILYGCNACIVWYDWRTCVCVCSVYGLDAYGIVQSMVYMLGKVRGVSYDPGAR